MHIHAPKQLAYWCILACWWSLMHLAVIWTTHNLQKPNIWQRPRYTASPVVRVAAHFIAFSVVDTSWLQMLSSWKPWTNLIKHDKTVNLLQFSAQNWSSFYQSMSIHPNQATTRPESFLAPWHDELENDLNIKGSRISWSAHFLWFPVRLEKLHGGIHKEPLPADLEKPWETILMGIFMGIQQES